MSSFQIKVLAAFLMTIDHIGVVFFPHQLALRYIGRLSFPLFAWLVGRGIWRKKMGGTSNPPDLPVTRN